MDKFKSIREKTIVFFIPNFKIGGAERVTINIANELSNHINEITLLVLNKDGPLIKEVSSKVKIVSLNKNRAIYSLLPFYLYLIKNRPDFIFSSLEHINALAVLGKIFYFRNLKVFVTEHSTASHAIVESFFDKLLFRLKRFIYNQADKVICVSNGSLEDLNKNFGIDKDKLINIYNPVITPEFVRTVDLLRHGELKRPVDYRYILSIGRLVYNKDFSTLIRAYAESEICNTHRLVIAGEGDERRILEELAMQLGISDKIYFPGFVNNPLSWLYFSDMFILTSRFEGLPTVLIEALGCSKIIISSDCPSGPREILENGKWGALFDVGDYVQLAKLLKSEFDANISRDFTAGWIRFTSQAVASKYLTLMDC